MWRECQIKLNNFVVSSFSSGGWGLMNQLMYYYGYGSDAKEHQKSLMLNIADSPWVCTFDFCFIFIILLAFFQDHNDIAPPQSANVGFNERQQAVAGSRYITTSYPIYYCMAQTGKLYPPVRKYFKKLFFNDYIFRKPPSKYHYFALQTISSYMPPRHRNN